MFYQKPVSSNEDKFARWLEKFGLIGFLFFFAKGMLWLLLPALLIMFGWE